MVAQRILVPVDFSDGSRAALMAADAIADDTTTLTLLHVLPITTVVVLDYTYAEPPEQVAENIAAVEKRLSSWAAELSTPAKRVKTIVCTGSAVDEIIDKATGADLIVMGTHGRTGVNRFLLGSVAERVIRGAPCSVLVHRPPPDPIDENKR